MSWTNGTRAGEYARSVSSRGKSESAVSVVRVAFHFVRLRSRLELANNVHASVVSLVRVDFCDRTETLVSVRVNV